MAMNNNSSLLIKKIIMASMKKVPRRGCVRTSTLPIGLVTILFLIAIQPSGCQGNEDFYTTESFQHFGTTFNPSMDNMNASQAFNCSIEPAVSGLNDKLNEILGRNVKLVEYHINFENYTVNPLTANITWNYKLNQWARVAHSHGQTILSLAFNYGILSLMTLSFGVEELPVLLKDNPQGCMGKLNENQKSKILFDLLLKDFQPHVTFRVEEGQSLCHQILREHQGYVQFSDYCCFKDIQTLKVKCTSEMPNFWLNLLNNLMVVLGIAVFLIGPMLTPNFIYSAALDTLKYCVKLKEPIYKSMCISYGDPDVDVFRENTVDLRGQKDFYNCKHVLHEAPGMTIIPIKISQFDITVHYGRLVPENKVPVGMWESITRALFMCKIRNIGPFQECCDAHIFGCVGGEQPKPWAGVCKLVGRLLMVVFLPVPFYIRLVLYYLFEHPEVISRSAASHHVGLPIWYEYRLMQFLTPVHPMFLGVYVVYFTSGFTFAYFSLSNRRSRCHQIVIDAFRELMDLSWLGALGMLVGNIVWPFKRFGLFGCLIGILYWPIVLPISLIACIAYSFPLIFLTCRMVVLSLSGKSKNEKSDEVELPGQLKKNLHTFDTDLLIQKIGESGTGSIIGKVSKRLKLKNVRDFFVNFFVALVCIFTLFSIMIMFAECVTFVLYVGIFTMMGIIVNASKVLKYGSLILLLVIYSYDCYNNVYKRYLKLNKSLFSEIKGRIKEVDEVTSLPSYLQENRGFKACELSEQADYENDDDFSQEYPLHWNINDLILFIDNDDTPRIPRKLFDDVCTIQVAGSPGPVYKSLLAATGTFLVIILFVLFVFIVVLTFGDVYRVSSTNQMLATMAGGFMPMMFRKVLRPSSPDLELGSVSFKSKLEEIIKNFWQGWPMYDFNFEIEEKEESEEEDSDDSCAKKEKEKPKKEKKKKSPPYKNSIDMLDNNILDHILQDDLKEKLSEMKSVRPAKGQFVDLLIVLPKDEHEDKTQRPEEVDTEWEMEWSSLGDFKEHVV